MFKHDSAFRWRPGRIYIPQSEFTGWLGTTATDVGQGAGAPVQKEISTFGMVGCLMEADGDVLDHYLRLPEDVDVGKDIKFRVHWTSGSATTADTIDWKVFYLGLVPNVTTIAAATNALTTVVAQDTVAGAYIDQVTEWGVLKAGTLSGLVEALTLQVEMDTFAVGLTEDKFLLGLQIAYSPRKLWGGDGMLAPADYPIAALSKQYS